MNRLHQLLSRNKTVTVDFSILLLCLLAYLSIIFFGIGTMVPRRDSDYDQILTLYSSIKNEIFSGNLPIINKYFFSGIPFIGDPTASLFNWILLPIFLLFPVNDAAKISIAIIILLSTFVMYVVLLALGIKRETRLFGSLLYATSGGIVARIAAGHLQVASCFIIFPLFLWILFSNKALFYRSIAYGLLMALLLLFSDFYLPYHFIILTFPIWLYMLGTKKIAMGKKFAYLCFTALAFLLPTGLFFYNFFYVVYPQMQRYFPIDSVAGSIHLPITIFSYFNPFGVTWYDRPSLQKILGYHFNWYEYYVFLSPTLLLLLQKKLFSKEHMYLSIIFLLGILYVANAYVYSPFYWLTHFFTFFSSFRVPQRILMPLSIFVVYFFIALYQKALQTYSTKKNLIIIFTVLTISIQMVINGLQVVQGFEPERVDNKKIAEVLRQKDSDNFSVAVFVCCMQQYLVEQKIPVVNMYYSWVPKKVGSFLDAQTLGYNFEPLRRVKPKYVIGKATDNFTAYSYELFYVIDDKTLWKYQERL